MTYSAHKLLVWLGAVILVAAACKSKEEEIVPTPAFSYDFADSGAKHYLPGYTTDNSIKLTNNSTGGATYLWNFGNGNTSTEKAPLITYAKSGTYTITLTTTSSTGTQRLATQSIKILDRVLKTITISGFKWNSIGEVPGWDDTKKADLTIEIGQRTTTGSTLTISNLLYRSDPIKNVTNTPISFSIPVTQKVILNPNVLSDFIINLYGNDGSGNRLVFSSAASAVGLSAVFSDATRFYTITSGSVTLQCDYQ